MTYEAAVQDEISRINALVTTGSQQGVIEKEFFEWAVDAGVWVPGGPSHTEIMKQFVEYKGWTE